jgi:hypothetical protein
MATINDMERLRRAVTEAAETLAHETTPGDDQVRPPSPGDLYVFDLAGDAALEWLVVREHPDDPDLLSVAPADEFPLAGTPDVALPRELAGRPLTVRCAKGLWLPATLCLPRLRVGAVRDEAVRLVRGRFAELVRGQAVGSAEQRSSDVDPEYETWMELVAQARELLQRRADRAPADLGLVIPFDRLSLKVPAELGSNRLQALAAESGSALLAALSNAMAETDVRYHEVLSGPDGKLTLMVAENGARGVWFTTSASRPPRLKALDVAGEPREATWHEGPKGQAGSARPPPPTPARLAASRALRRRLQRTWVEPGSRGC